MPSHLTARTGITADGSVDLSQRVIQKSEFGKRLYALMLEKGWTQSDLSRQAKLGRDSISTYVRGRSVPTPQNLEKLAKALSVTPEELYPNYSANAAAIDEPVFQVKQVNDDSGQMWLTINMKVDAEKAVKVMQILNDKS
jgi:transcriptional regulator with XRE-family HTH domain